MPGGWPPATPGQRPRARGPARFQGLRVGFTLEQGPSGPRALGNAEPSVLSGFLAAPSSSGFPSHSSRTHHPREGVPGPSCVCSRHSQEQILIYNSLFFFWKPLWLWSWFCHTPQRDLRQVTPGFIVQGILQCLGTSIQILIL